MSSQLAELQRALGRIEGKLDSLVGEDGRLARIEKKQGDHDRRIGRTENRLSWYSGAAAVLGGILGALASYFAKHT